MYTTGAPHPRHTHLVVLATALSVIFTMASTTSTASSVPRLGADRFDFTAQTMNHFPDQRANEKTRFIDTEALVRDCDFKPIDGGWAGDRTPDDPVGTMYDGISDQAGFSPTETYPLGLNVTVCVIELEDGRGTMYAHRVGTFDIPSDKSVEIIFTPKQPLQQAFITEYIQTVRHPDQSHYTFPPLHPHHIMVHGTARRDKDEKKTIYTKQFYPYWENEVFVAGSPISVAQEFCDDNDPSCMYHVFPPGLGIEKAENMLYESDTRLDNIGPSTLKNLTFEICWVWRPQVMPQLPEKLLLAGFHEPARIKPIIQGWFAAERSMGHGYTVLPNTGETILWRTYNMPSGGVFHPGGLVHIHSSLDAQLWVLDREAHGILPLGLQNLSRTFEDLSVKLPYQWAEPERISQTDLSPLPINLKDYGLTIEEVQEHILGRDADAVRCMYKGRQMEVEVEGVLLRGDHGIYARTAQLCEQQRWRFEAGQPITLIGFNKNNSADIAAQMHSHWHPYVTFDDPVYNGGEPGFGPNTSTYDSPAYGGGEPGFGTKPVKFNVELPAVTTSIAQLISIGAVVFSAFMWGVYSLYNQLSNTNFEYSLVRRKVDDVVYDVDDQEGNPEFTRHHLQPSPAYAPL